ncbi:MULTISPECIES: DoxX family protein [unclassified Pseudoalteromonas]|uniref:DoxX family protein n=1 Tax=unclassified Pseudoalteromonas TaxID=194690 RepID=UPI003014BE0E
MNMINIIKPNTPFAALLTLLGRVGLAAIFTLAAVNKIQYYDGNAAYMAASGLPGELLPLVIAFELVGGVFILFGVLTQLTALAFALFSVVSALLFHFDLADQMQFLMFFKNIAMAGGFLALAVSGAGQWSIDHKLATRQQ